MRYVFAVFPSTCVLNDYLELLTPETVNVELLSRVAITMCVCLYAQTRVMAGEQ